MWNIEFLKVLSRLKSLQRKCEFKDHFFLKEASAGELMTTRLVKLSLAIFQFYEVKPPILLSVLSAYFTEYT